MNPAWARAVCQSTLRPKRSRSRAHLVASWRMRAAACSGVLGMKSRSGATVGLHKRADAPLTKPAAALARLLSEIGRGVLQKA